MCEMHEEILKDIPPEVIKIIQDNEIEVRSIITKIGNLIGPYVFTLGTFDENGVPQPATSTKELPVELQNMSNAAGFLYMASWMAAEASFNEHTDELLSYVAVNAINDSNAYTCVNTSKDKVN